MNRLTFAAIFAFAIACVGCGNSNPLTASPSSISTPSGISSQTTGTSQTTGVIRPARWDDGAWPNPPSDIVWVGPFFSTVRITNKSGQVQDFTMALFDASTGEDHETQHLIRAVTRRFQIGETATFGFDMSDECGSIYQRDVWESGQVGVGRLYAEGGPFLKGRCNGDAPPVVTPPVVTPPPTVDACPNIDGNQSSVPEGDEVRGGLCLPIEHSHTPLFCQDTSATNFGQLLPCVYPTPPNDGCPHVTSQGRFRRLNDDPHPEHGCDNGDPGKGHDGDPGTGNPHDGPPANDPVVCAFTLSDTSFNNVPKNGKHENITVTANDSSCAWTAASNTSWIINVTPSSSVGTGSVSFDVVANSGAERDGGLFVATQSVSVTQHKN